MAANEAPPFWWKDLAWQSFLLWPVSYVYGSIAHRRMQTEHSYSTAIPVICVGNFIAGGAGKTPTTQLLAKHARKKGYRPGILSRGHGGAITAPTIVNLERHNAYDVGDEALLHAKHNMTVVSTDRTIGAKLLEDQGCDIIIMDDGFQNPSLQKDYNLVVVDAKRGLGNGFTIPAGPMRMPLKAQLMHADAILVTGKGEKGITTIRKAARAGKPVFTARLKVIGKSKFKKMDVLAFAGIADGGKFFDTLSEIGVNVVEKAEFGDHHVYTREECEDLLDKAKRKKLKVVTTTKDHARLQSMGDAPQRLADESIAVPVELVPEEPDMLERILSKAIASAQARKLSAKAK